MALTTSGRLQITTSLTKAADLVGTLTAAPSINEDLAFATGTASGLADKVFFDTRTIALSSSESHDLTALTDVFGDALAFVKIKMIYIKAALANTNDVIVGNGATPFIGPFGAAGASEQRIPPGGVYLVRHPTTGWTVTGATADILKVANGGAGTGVDYDIILVGTSA